MIKTIFLFLLVVGLMGFIITFDKPNCINNNLIFDYYPPETKKYKDELAFQLAHHTDDDLSFWVSDYTKVGDRQNLYIDVVGDSICAKMMIRIEDSSKGLQNLIRTQGKGYIGAKLKGLQYQIQQSDSSTDFVFTELEKIID